jgi:hypothetical protein
MEKSAESSKASLGGNLSKLLKQAKDRQAERIAQKPVDALGGFKTGDVKGAAIVYDVAVRSAEGT